MSPIDSTAVGYSTVADAPWLTTLTALSTALAGPRPLSNGSRDREFRAAAGDVRGRRGALLALHRAVYPEYTTGPRELHLATQLDAPGDVPHRYVALDLTTKRVAGYGAVWPWKARQRKYRMDLIVGPDWRRRGIGAMLLERLLADLRAADATTLQARVRADQVEALTFLRCRGFAEVQHMDALALDVSRVDVALLAALTEHGVPAGVRILSLAEAGSHDPRCLSKLHALQNAVLPDWPDPDPTRSSPIPFDVFARRLGAEVRDPEGFFVAASRDRLIGYSDISGFGTAVHPDFRGRGLATALKARVIAHARERQVPRLYTCTASPAMRGQREARLRPRSVRDPAGEDAGCPRQQRLRGSESGGALARNQAR